MADGPNDPTPVCVTKSQLAALLSAAAASPSPESVTSSGGSSVQNSSPTSPESVTSTSTPDTPPDIQVNGDNPAIVQVGANYNDLGATITGPSADLNLGIMTYLNGTLAEPLTIDTTQPATDTIQYVATDQSGLSATSTRTVIIQAPAGAGSAVVLGHSNVLLIRRKLNAELTYAHRNNHEKQNAGRRANPMLRPKRAAHICHPAPDYLTRLARTNQVKGVRVAGTWHLSFKSLAAFVGRRSPDPPRPRSP